MSKLTIGSRFDYNYKTWTLLDRHENYCLVEGKQMMQPTVYVATNVLKNGDSDVCQPNVTDNGQGSIFYDLNRMRQHFDEQCLLINKRKAQAAETAEQDQQKQKQRAMKNAKILLTQSLKIALESEARAICLTDMTADQLLGDKKLQLLMSKIAVADILIETLKR